MPGFSVPDTDPERTERLVKTAVTPRPIAWVSTRSDDGVDNLAPFSSTNYVDSSPPVMMVNVGKRADGGEKDTARNVLETKVFAFNVVTEALLEPMDRSSEAVGPSESEFDRVDATRAACDHIAAPRVAEADVTMECRLRESMAIHDRTVLLGDVVYVHVDDAVTTDGRIDARKLDTVGRLGGPYYTVATPLPYERKY